MLLASTSSFVNRVLLSCFRELVQNNLVGINADSLGKQDAISQHVSEFVSDSTGVSLGVPLEALKQFTGFDGDTLRQVLRAVKLSPVPLSHEGCDLISN
jgi:hypothetical protein